MPKTKLLRGGTGGSGSWVATIYLHRVAAVSDDRKARLLQYFISRQPKKVSYTINMELLSRTALGLLSLSAVFAGTASAVESFRKPTVAFAAGNGTLLASRSSPVTIHADAADWPGVLRAAHDLALDFGRVTGANGSLTTTGSATANASVIFNVTGISNNWSVGSNSNGYPTNGAGRIIVGTIGNSSLIDGLIASGQLDVSAIEGQWEAYVSTFVENAGNGTGSALVIAGKFKAMAYIPSRF